MKLKHLFFLLIVLSACQSKSLESSHNGISVLGQTAPPDMLFIPGNDTFPAFYISKIEEPNINYLTYLLYLDVVFGDSYPTVVQAAIPKKLAGKQHYYNDPYLESYLSHPAFAYYPVTNLTYEQIDNYLYWKTDRLNESILIKKGILNMNPEQRDEDNFNTEAYLNGQYQGDVRKNLRASNGGERSVALSDGILFTGFRLPTEAEWDYLCDSAWNAKGSKKGKFKHHPFGEDYYPLKWTKIYGRTGNDYHYGAQDYLSEDVKSFDLSQVKIPQEAQVQVLSKAFNKLQYDGPKSKQIYNLEGGVREWVVDEYKAQANPKDMSWEAVMKAGAYLFNEGLRDENNAYLEKDHLGHMRHFRYIAYNADGTGKEVGSSKQYQEELEPLYSQRTQWKNYIENYTRLRTNRALDSAYIQKVELRKEQLLKQLKNEQQSKEMNSYQLQQLKREIENLKRESIANYYIPAWTDRANILTGKMKSLEEAKKHLQELETLIASVEANAEQLETRQRVIKGGDWKSPNRSRAAMREDTAAIDLGFRCVLPYTGAPVHKSFKVKWRTKPIYKKF